MSLKVFFVQSQPTGQTEDDFAEQVLELLNRVRQIKHEFVDGNGEGDIVRIDCTTDFATILEALASGLRNINKAREAEALRIVVEHCLEDKAQGGLQLSRDVQLTKDAYAGILFLVEGWLESLNGAEHSRKLPKPLSEKPPGRRPMTLSEKILTHHAIGAGARGVKVGDVLRITVDWVISSEISWVGIMKTLKEFDDYKIWRNDRFWLAGDHVVDPRNYDTPLSKRLLAASEKVTKDYKLTESKGPNYTIIHTEFVRARAEPGMLAVGADSHTCSSGAVGCLAMGLGAADVAMPLITGETWFQVPEAINIRFVGEPGLGIGGKDTILYILGELKRNTVAAERIVEFSGPGLKYLSTDARFAISNMCTEFGAVTGIFVPDETTLSYINSRKQKNRKSSSLYFKPDHDAQYAQTFDIDLSKVKNFIAVYPNPDDVVPVSEKVGIHLDGVFIGACTTTLEDLILAALVLEMGLKKKLPIMEKGKRHVVPGSLPVSKKLEVLGLLKVFEDAGFIIGLPGCSFCVGMGSDQAQEGETWLSSQNRNFQNRMGKGSFGNLASAATVAASSFSMNITDPSELLAEIDMDLFDQYRQYSRKGPAKNALDSSSPVIYVEPGIDSSHGNGASKNSSVNGVKQPKSKEPPSLPPIKSNVVALGDYIDTDALAPAQHLLTASDDKDMGKHCLEATHPEFREKVRNGQQVVVAGKAFGCGSSREEAVRALKGAGVQCVIARSFAFIYGRNQPNLGLLGFTITDDSFYSVATEGAEIEITLDSRTVRVGGKEFEFQLTDLELSLLANGGMTEAYKRFGEHVFESLRGGAGKGAKVNGDTAGGEMDEEMAEMATGAIDDPEGALQELQW